MPLNTIPALPESYPLYDWADWQSSRDSLVKGTPTKYFAKEAWNAIVDGLSDALEAAGEEWDDTYTTAEGAKITVAYGKLTAQKFNSVRHNIDRPAPLGWAWAMYPSFRGYTGREDFRGSQDYGKACDRVYPEYIIELVRKLNLLLEIMRGTALIDEAEMQHLAPLPYIAEAASGQAARVESLHLSTVKQSAEARAGKAVYTETTYKSAITVSPEVVAKNAASGSVSLQIPVPVQSEGESKQGLPIEVSNVAAVTRVVAKAEATKHVEVSSTELSISNVQAAVDAPRILPVAPESVSTVSASEIEALQKKPLPASGEVTLASESQTEVVQRASVPTGAEIMPVVHIEISVDWIRPVETSVFYRGGTKTVCELDTAWLPPVWVDGGLWIRQAHAVTQNENGELEVT